MQLADQREPTSKPCQYNRKSRWTRRYFPGDLKPRVSSEVVRKLTCINVSKTRDSVKEEEHSRCFEICEDGVVVDLREPVLDVSKRKTGWRMGYVPLLLTPWCNSTRKSKQSKVSSRSGPGLHNQTPGTPESRFFGDCFLGVTPFFCDCFRSNFSGETLLQINSSRKEEVDECRIQSSASCA